jgi:predicted metalloprotease with PDZ domain
VGINIRSRRRAEVAQGKQPGPRVSLGADTGSSGNQVAISRVFDGGTARQAGLAAGDLLVAVDGVRITPKSLPQLLARYEPGESATFHYFRRGELRSALLSFSTPDDAAWSLAFQPDAAGEALARRTAWLNGH